MALPIYALKRGYFRGRESARWLALVLWSLAVAASPNKGYLFMYTDTQLIQYSVSLPNKGCFSGGVLAHQQDHRFGIKIWIIELRRMEVVEVVERL